MAAFIPPARKAAAPAGQRLSDPCKATISRCRDVVLSSGTGIASITATDGRVEVFPITHTLPLDQAERGFEIFKNKQDHCEKVVLKP